MKATIIGGRGFIGSHLARHLTNLGYSVYIPDKDDSALLHSSLGVVFYCAGTTSDFRSRPFDTIDAHISLLSTILQKADFQKLIYLSSTRVYYHSKQGTVDSNILVNPLYSDDLFNLSKLTGEALCRCSGRSGVIIVRLSNVCGNDFRSGNFIYSIIRDAVTKGTILLRSSMDSEKDYIHIDDVVLFLQWIADVGSQPIYNVASGVNISNKMIVEIIQKQTDCAVSLNGKLEIYRFPIIDVKPLVDEFKYVPREPVLWLEDLVSNTVKKGGF